MRLAVAACILRHAQLCDVTVVLGMRQSIGIHLALRSGRILYCSLYLTRIRLLTCNVSGGNLSTQIDSWILLEILNLSFFTSSGNDQDWIAEL